MRFETLYLFTVQLVFFLSLGVAVWVWGLLALDAFTTARSTTSVVFWGVGLRVLAHTLGTSLAFAA